MKNADTKSLLKLLRNISNEAIRIKNEFHLDESVIKNILTNEILAEEIIIKNFIYN